jgi:hypothetical protein
MGRVLAVDAGLAFRLRQVLDADDMERAACRYLAPGELAFASAVLVSVIGQASMQA